ncbi:MAG: hypothetical protein ABJD24_10450 [Acidimicrobiales bacterium]
MELEALLHLGMNSRRIRNATGTAMLTTAIRSTDIVENTSLLRIRQLSSLEIVT